LLKSNPIKEDPYKHSVVSLFALVGMSICAAMAFIALFNKNYTLTITLLVASFIYFIGFYVCKKLNNVQLSSAITLYSLYLLMFYLMFTGGVAQTGPLWIFIVAPVSVFVHGLKRGLIDIAIFVVIIIFIMFFPSGFPLQAIYPTEFKLRLIYSFLTMTFLSSLYEYSREISFKKTIELSEKYQQLAHFDPLTNLSNRRHAHDIMKQEQSRLRRNNEILSILLCDVDHFKQINDQFGHNAGDAVLVELAKIFTNQIREQDNVSRWGGEEFLFILPQTSAENAQVIAEKIRQHVESYLFNYQNTALNITVSIGIAQFKKSSNIDDVINSADKYLYLAKESGRNQTQPSK
jgi:diguanylate cyclase (GGDEF)-like protein